MTPDRLALCGHFVLPGTPAELVLRRAESFFAESAKAEESGDALASVAFWKDARTLVRDVTDPDLPMPGYLGRAVDTELVAAARRSAAGGLYLAEMREVFVEAGMAAGLTEDVARRSVVEGFLRGANPVGGHRGGRAAPPPRPVPVHTPEAPRVA